MNRAEQSKNTGRLEEKAGVSSTSRLYNPLRPSKILKSENVVTEIINVLSEEYINPFDQFLDHSKLINLSSGVPLEINYVLKSWDTGEQQFKTFTKEYISSNVKSFHDPIRRNKITLFKQTSKSVTVSRNGKTSIVEVNRNIIGKLLAISAKRSKAVDFEVSLCYPLTSTPLSLSNPDGTRRVTQKSRSATIIPK